MNRFLHLFAIIAAISSVLHFSALAKTDCGAFWWMLNDEAELPKDFEKKSKKCRSYKDRFGLTLLHKAVVQANLAAARALVRA